MIPHIVFEALIKHYMYRTAPAKFRFITCPLCVERDPVVAADSFLLVLAPRKDSTLRL